MIRILLPAVLMLALSTAPGAARKDRFIPAAPSPASAPAQCSADSAESAQPRSAAATPVQPADAGVRQLAADCTPIATEDVQPTAGRRR